ncbi:hypothetical protein GGF41_004157 [Coemansia sp. RSA 2531]|nr:hypothetical protein GGF41_004157 [Coemansia sp. RSA 2531]
MFTRDTLFALLTTAAVLLAVQGNEAPGRLPKNVCPSADKCYIDTVSPPCTPGQACSMVSQQVVACAWSCGNKHTPHGCTERCKPCKAEVCTDVCVCEIVCSSSGPCKAAKR